MPTATRQEPIDRLAERANFGDIIDDRSVGARRGAFAGHFNYNGRLYSRWSNTDPNKRWSDLEIVAFYDPTDYSSVRMYLIKANEVDRVTRTHYVINLSRRKPKYTGKAAVETLKKYARQL